MAKSINCFENKSLSDLDIVPGQVVAFDNIDYECPHPFILAIPEKLVRGFEDHPRGIRLIYWHGCDSKDREEWTLHTRGRMIGLWSPQTKYESRGKTRVPNVKIMTNANEWYGNNAYVIERAYSGRDAVQNGLQSVGLGLDFYADCMEKGELITERGTIGKFARKIGLESLLPNQLRFALF